MEIVMSEQDQKKKVFRTTFLILPDFQIRFIAYMLVAVLMALFLFYVSDMYFYKQVLTGEI